MGPYPLSDGSMAPDGEMGPYPLSDNTNLLGAQSQYSLYRNYGTQYATSSISSNQQQPQRNYSPYHQQQQQSQQNYQFGAHNNNNNNNYGSSHSGYSYVVEGHSYKNNSHNQVNRGVPNPSRSGSGRTMIVSGGSGRCLMAAMVQQRPQESVLWRQAPTSSHHSNATIPLCASNSNSPVPRRRAHSHGRRQDSFRRHSAHARITASTSGVYPTHQAPRPRTIFGPIPHIHRFAKHSSNNLR